MEVRFPTYSLRQMQRAQGQPVSMGDTFIQVIGKLDADTEQDLSQHSRQAGYAGPEDQADGKRRPLRPAPLGAEVISAVLRSAGEADEAERTAEERLVGRMLDVLA